MKRLLPWVLLAVAVIMALLWQSRQDPAPELPGRSSAPGTVSPASAPPAAARPGTGSVSVAALPEEARHTLRLILSDGSFPHRQDGQIFHNRERLLPLRERGWYREYTVATPGARDRGARRIVAGDDPAHEFWYTSDHYRSFQRIDSIGDMPP